MKWERDTDLERKEFIFDVILKRIIFKFRYFTLFETVRVTRYSEKVGYCFKYNRYIGYSDKIIEKIFRNKSILDKILSKNLIFLNKIFNKEESILDFEYSSKFDEYCDKFEIGEYFTQRVRQDKLKELGI